MFKRLLVTFCFLLLVSQAFAVISIVEPVDTKLSDDGEISFGKIAGGEILRVVVKKKSDLGSDWVTIGVDGLPAGWESETVETDKTLIALISLAPNAEISTQRITFTLANDSIPSLNESFYGSVYVNENLLDVSFESLTIDATLGQSAEFVLTINNDSIASHLIMVESTLPYYWFSGKTIEVGPLETEQVLIEVMPYSYGEKNFSFEVSSELNNQSLSFPAKLDVKPNLVGMFRAPAAGFPFFSPGMLPYYLISSLLSFF